MLGVIGEQKDFVLEQDYNHTAIPEYLKPIKVQPIQVVFNKSTLKAFTKAKETQGIDINVNYTDSLTEKPSFLKLEIADRVSIIEALNDKSNKSIFKFLKSNEGSHIITSISMAFNETDKRVILNADEVFLESSGIKNYVLSAYKDGELQQRFFFNKSVVFAFQTSSFCWKQNNKYQLEIADLIESNEYCPNKTYKSAHKADKKINYFKL